MSGPRPSPGKKVALSGPVPRPGRNLRLLVALASLALQVRPAAAQVTDDTQPTAASSSATIVTGQRRSTASPCRLPPAALPPAACRLSPGAPREEHTPPITISTPAVTAGGRYSRKGRLQASPRHCSAPGSRPGPCRLAALPRDRRHDARRCVAGRCGRSVPEPAASWRLYGKHVTGLHLRRTRIGQRLDAAIRALDPLPSRLAVPAALQAERRHGAA